MRHVALVAGLVISMVMPAAAQPRPAPAKAAPKKAARKPKAKPKPPPPKQLTAEEKARKARADALFEDGRRYLAAGEHALACTAFEQSHEADPAIGTQLNIALCYEDWGKLASAYRAYLEAERLAKDKNDDREAGARKKVDELAPKVPHLQIDLPPDADPGAVFLFDGKQISRTELADDLLVDPGPHEIEARVAGQPPRRTQVELVIGERKRLTIDVPKPQLAVVVTTAPRDKRRFYGGIALAGGGTLTVGIASFVALVARQDYADAVANCPQLMCESREDYDATQSARSRATAMTFVGLAGAAMVGAGVYLIVTSRGARREQRVELVPTVSPDGVGFAIGGRL